MHTSSKTPTKQDKISKAKKGADDVLKLLLAKHIQKVRKRRGVTARKAAADIGISRTALTQMETGRNHYNAVTLFRLASSLKCDIKELFPTVPESISLTDADAADVARENAQAAELLKKAFPRK